MKNITITLVTILLAATGMAQNVEFKSANFKDDKDGFKAATEAIKKGDEYGYFSFGGSCVITLYPSKKIAFREDLIDQSGKGFECYFKFGTRLGDIRH